VLLVRPPSRQTELLIEDFKNKRDEARTAISIAQQAQAKYIGREFQVGDLVLLKFNRKPGHPGYLPPKEHRTKIGPTSTPLRIVKKLCPLTYKLALPAGSQMHDVVSVVQLQRYGKDDGNIRPLRPLFRVLKAKKNRRLKKYWITAWSKGRKNIWSGGKDTPKTRHHGNLQSTSKTLKNSYSNLSQAIRNQLPNTLLQRRDPSVTRKSAKVPIVALTIGSYHHVIYSCHLTSLSSMRFSVLQQNIIVRTLAR